MRLAYAAARERLPEYSSRFSRKDFTLRQLFACLVVKEQLQLSYRKAEAFLSDCPDWCREIGLRRIPDHNTLCRVAKFLLENGSRMASRWMRLICLPKARAGLPGAPA